MAAVKSLLDIARAEIGVKESPMNSNNVKYNTAFYGQAVHDGLWGTKFPWCVVFAWWCCNQAGVSLPVKTASCTSLRDAAQAAGLWITSGYQPGDIVIYDWGGDKKPDHCGIVESVIGSSVTAIEGNTAVGNDSNGGEVMRRTRSTDEILGAVRPKYEEVKPVESAEVQEAQAWAKKNGIMTGYADGEMHLDDPVTRRQLLLVEYRKAKLDGKV